LSSIKARQCRLETIEIFERIAAVDEGLEIAGCKCDCLVVTLNRVLETLQSRKHNATVVVRRRRTRVDVERMINQSKRRRVVATLVIDDAQHMQAVEVLRTRQQQLAVEALGLAQQARLVERQRLGKKCRRLG
jgi:hypothetical protein